MVCIFTHSKVELHALRRVTGWIVAETCWENQARWEEEMTQWLAAEEIGL